MKRSAKSLRKQELKLKRMFQRNGYDANLVRDYSLVKEVKGWDVFRKDWNCECDQDLPAAQLKVRHSYMEEGWRDYLDRFEDVWEPPFMKQTPIL